MTKKKYFIALSVLLLGCGGSDHRNVGTPGSSHATAGDEADEAIDNEGEGFSESSGEGEEVGAEESATTSEETLAPVTFVLKNKSKESLFLNMDKGWSAVIYAYSGKPPNAKSILMFPTHCTASCDMGPEEVCPYCPEPTTARAIEAAEKHDEVLPGESRLVPWDASVFSYKRTKGKRDGKQARCKCSETSEAPPAQYTIKACGLRKTKSAKSSSKYQCVEGTLTLPITEPVQVKLSFN